MEKDRDLLNVDYEVISQVKLRHACGSWCYGIFRNQGTALQIYKKIVLVLSR